MKNKSIIPASAKKAATKDEKDPYPGYPVYPESQDIYTKFKEEKDTDPENVSEKKTENYRDEKLNEKDFKQDHSGDDLDIPYSETIHKQGNLAGEDEENDYYSLGGDDHNNLEEDKETAD